MICREGESVESLVETLCQIHLPRIEGTLKRSRTDRVMQYSSKPIFGVDDVQAHLDTVCLWWRPSDVVAVVDRPY